MNFTVFGAQGFIGSHLSEALGREENTTVYTPLTLEEGGLPDEAMRRDLGHVFYCIGLTANFRERPFDTVEAHVCLLKRVLELCKFESLTYLSSTRVYENAASTGEEAPLQVCPGNPGHLYNLSKLAGESLCLASGRKTRIVRLSNVFGCGMPQQSFLGQVLGEAASTGKVRFLTAPQSAKDYVSVRDVVRWLPRIALHGSHAIYNVASGRNTSNAEIASLLGLRGVAASFAENAAEWIFPAIDTGRLFREFGGAQGNLPGEFDDLLHAAIRGSEAADE